MPRTTASTVIDTLNEYTEAFSDALRANNERAYRLGRIILDEAERTQKERNELLRRWMQSPADLAELASAVLDTWTRRTRRRMEVGRALGSELSEIGPATRSIFERVTEASRETVQAGARATRRAAGSVSEEIAERASDVSERAEQTARELRHDGQSKN